MIDAASSGSWIYLSNVSHESAATAKAHRLAAVFASNNTPDKLANIDHTQ